MAKRFTGFTEKTPKHFLLNAGAYFKNYDPTTDTFDSAVKAGKLIGATKGGGEFSAVPAVRQIEVDGVSGRTKGLEIIDSWEVYLKAIVIEVTQDVIKVALCASKVTEDVEGYDRITAKDEITLDDYIENVTWVGTLSGSNKPVIIIVYNALSTDGLKLTTQDKSEATVATTFYGHYDTADLDKTPFDILYPKSEAAVATTTQTE